MSQRREVSRTGVCRDDSLSGVERAAGQRSTEREEHSTVTMGAGEHAEPIVS